jgi:hypothetical protein
MPYAQGRTRYDADSHLMELSEWLPKYADPGVRERIRPLYLGGAGAKAAELTRMPRSLTASGWSRAIAFCQRRPSFDRKQLSRDRV